MKFGLREEIIQQINDVFAKYLQIEKAVLYGSRAKGNFKNGSDIDLTLKGVGLNLSVINSLLNELDDLLLPYTFDVSVFNQISNVDLIEHIERVGKVFYEKHSHDND
ncbi:MAG: nucleotidyltransferase domain-containing protein [Desulfobacteraceae bacterium]|nr:nucleotidyltransferase domain-containing protein [Desulfobacteraceae bacterium]